MRSPSVPRALPLLELGGLLLVALLSLLFHLRLPGRLPSEGDYRAVAERLKAEARPGDAVLLFPWWAERARLFVPPEVPVYGYLGSDKDDLAAHSRIWVLGQPELPARTRTPSSRTSSPSAARWAPPCARGRCH